MVALSQAPIEPKVGFFLTRYLYTDRRSYQIVTVEGDMFTTAAGTFRFKGGKVQMPIIGGRFETLKDHRITVSDESHTDLSF